MRPWTVLEIRKELGDVVTVKLQKRLHGVFWNRGQPLTA